jgi:hypothetical protein
MKLLSWLVCGFIAAQYAIAAAAPAPIGQVVGLQGAVHATTPGEAPRLLALNDPVYTGDTITTGPDARLKVLFKDDSVFSQGENGEVVLDEYTFDPASKADNSFCMRILRGFSRIITGRITDLNPDRFKVKTSRATIGIRGCEVGFDVQPRFDQIIVVSVPPGHRIVIQNEVPGRPDATAEISVTTPLWIQIREDGRMIKGAIDDVILQRLSTETTPALTAPPAPETTAQTPPPDSTTEAPETHSLQDAQFSTRDFPFQQLPSDAPIADFPLVLVSQDELKLAPEVIMNPTLAPQESEPLSEMRQNVYRVPKPPGPPPPGPKPPKPPKPPGPPVESNAGL